MAHPVPDVAGLCRLGELGLNPTLVSCTEEGVTPPELLSVMDAGAVKLEGLVVIDTTCEQRSCPPDDPCCAQCTGSYRLEMDRGEDAPGITLPIRTPTIGCTGTVCGLSCAPLEPGRRYRLWGSFIPKTGTLHFGTLHYVGSCPL
jgi:hypothetical protein